MFTLAALALALNAHAGAHDSKLATATLMVQQGDCVGALSRLEEVNEHLAELKEKNRPKAQFYLGRCLTQVQVNGREVDKQEQATDGALRRAVDLLVAARSDAKWASRATAELEIAIPHAFNAAAAAYNRGDVAAAAAYFETLERAWPEDHRPSMNHGFALVATDRAAAVVAFENALRLYEAHPPDAPDAAIGRVAQAVLDSWLITKEPAKARDEAPRLAALLQKEHDRASDPAKKDELAQDIVQVRRYEIGALQDLGELGTPAGLALLDAAIAAEPDEAALKVAYANAVAEADPAKAQEMYAKALENEPTNANILFNLGVMLVNDAATGDNRDAGLESLKRAQPNLENALDNGLDPESSKLAITALLQIYEVTGQKAKMPAMKARLDGLSP